MNAPKSALNQVVDIEIDGIDLTSNANVSFAKKVLSETLGEISSHEQEAIVIRLETIFKQWQLQFGVYPPKPSIQRILESLGHGSVRPAQIAYSQYILRCSSAEAAAIKPWHSHNDIYTPVDLFNNLFLESYESKN